MERLDGGFTLIWVKGTIFEETINCENESRLKGMFIFWGQKGVWTVVTGCLGLRFRARY